MLPLVCFVAVGALLLALGLSGAIASKHFVVEILSIELVFAGSIIASVGYFAYLPGSNGSFFIMLLSIWAVAGAEIMGLVALYTYMRGKLADFDLRKLAKLKG